MIVKFTFCSTFLLIFISSLSGQILKVGPDRYELNKKSLQILENYYQRALRCESNTYKIDSQIDILISNHKFKDSIMIAQKIDINRIMNESLANELNKKNCETKLSKELDKLKVSDIEIKKLKKNSVWLKIAIIGQAALIGILIAKI